jgi:hypothetical protein
MITPEVMAWVERLIEKGVMVTISADGDVSTSLPQKKTYDRSNANKRYYENKKLRLLKTTEFNLKTTELPTENLLKTTESPRAHVNSITLNTKSSLLKEENLNTNTNTLSRGNKAETTENTESVKPDATPKALADWWNTEVAEKNGLAKVSKLNESRAGKCRVRIKEGIWGQRSIIANEISKSAFLRGLQANWRIDFDFLTANDTNWIKVTEGKYYNPNGQSINGGGYPRNKDQPRTYLAPGAISAGPEECDDDIDAILERQRIEHERRNANRNIKN